MKIYLKVKPKASKNQVKKINSDLYHVWMTAPAYKNQLKGLTSPHKIIEIIQ